MSVLDNIEMCLPVWDALDRIEEICPARAPAAVAGRAAASARLRRHGRASARI